MTSRRSYWISKNDETAAILVYQTNPLGVELYFYANNFFVSVNVSENPLYYYYILTITKTSQLEFLFAGPIFFSHEIDLL